MKVYVACDDPAMMRRLRVALHDLNIDWGVYSSGDARTEKAAMTSKDGCEQAILYASLQFGPDQIARLNEIQEEIDGSPIIVVGNLPDQAILLDLMQVGITAFIDFSHDLESGIRRQIDRLTIGKTSKSRMGRMVAVVSASGGSGASFLATNLAAGFASHDQSCCLIDMKSNGGDLATILRLTPRHTIVSLAAKSDQIDRAMFEQSLVKHECGVHLLAGAEAYSDTSPNSANAIQRILRIARCVFSSVVIELDDIQNPDSVRTLSQCERIIVPLRLDFTSLRRTKRLLERLEQRQISLENVVVVANRCGEARQFRISSVEQLLDVNVSHQIPDAAQAVNESVNLGAPIVRTAPRSRVGLSILEIVDKILNKATEPQRASKSLLDCLRLSASGS